MTPAGYSGTPLPTKLGIKAEHRALLVGAPTGFDLTDLPPGAVLHRRAGSAPYEVVVTFCRDRAALERTFGPSLARTPPNGAVWVAWPKRASGVPTDLGDDVVRSYGLAHGTVDTKVCAIDDTWSALRFVRRLADR